MKQTVLNKSTCQQLIKGASIFACGGGLSFSDQLKSLQQLDSYGEFSLSLLDPATINNTDLFVTCGEIGPTHLPPISKAQVPLMLTQLQKIIGKNVKGIIPLEIGQETITLETALLANLPILDADIGGGRAVPSLDLWLPNALGLDYHFSPLIATNEKGVIKILKNSTGPVAEENFLRDFSEESKGIVFFVGGMVDGAFVKKHLVCNSYSNAMTIGASDTSMSVKTFPAKIHAVKICNKEGFLSCIISISVKKANWSVLVQNEIMAVIDTKSGRCIAKAPDCITFLNDEGYGMNNGKLKEGQKLWLSIRSAHPYFKRKKVKDKWDNSIQAFIKEYYEH